VEWLRLQRPWSAHGNPPPQPRRAVRRGRRPVRRVLRRGARLPHEDELPGAAFLQAPDSTNDHDLGLFEVGGEAAPSGAGRGTVGLYHLAWELGSLDELEEHASRLADAGALVGASDHGTTKSLYAKDPDGLEFEVVWIVPAHLLTGAEHSGIEPLDLAADMARYGGQTRGGVGISIPLGVSV